MAILDWAWSHAWFCLACGILLESLLPVPLQPTAWIARGGIRLYQIILSPAVPSICKFEPTCSQYGLEAVRKYGTVKGGLLTTWRILRCNPLSDGGEDPLL
jgi:putative membrane protein insertion efficiency factor